MTRAVPVVRRPRFDLSETPLHWIHGEPFATHFWNVLHLLLPAGERWFVRTFREAQPLVTDPHLLARLRAFSGQEGMHAGAHDTCLGMLARHGIDTAPFTKNIDRLFERRMSADTAPRSLARAWLDRRVAGVAAIEHFTSVGGQWLLDARIGERATIDPVMLDLLEWHAAEEVEHRSVAFDVFEHVSGSRFVRRSAMAMAAPIFFETWLAGLQYLLRRDPATKHLPTHRPALVRQWHALAKRGLVPPPGRIWAWVPRYMRADFHPENEGSLEKARAVLERPLAVVTA